MNEDCGGSCWQHFFVDFSVNHVDCVIDCLGGIATPGCGDHFETSDGVSNTNLRYDHRCN
jgi:hypothetical protein